MKIVGGFFVVSLLFLQGLFAQELDTVLANQFYQKARKFGDAGDYKQSIIYYQKALTNYEKVPYWFGYVKSLNGLGACHTLISEHKEAQEYLQLALSTGLERLGEIPEIADTYQNLGFDWSRQGDYEKQFENYKRALKIRLNTLGKIHPKVAQTYSSLSVSYKYRGDYENALTTAKKGLDTRLKSVDSNDFSLSQDYTNIGAIYLSKGEFKNAQEYFQRALDVMENAIGEQNQFKAIGYSNLGKSYDAQGNYVKAIGAYENALEVLIQLLGEKHVYAGIFYNNLGAAWLNIGNATKAISYHKKALNIFNATLSEHHPYVATTYINLGKCFVAIEKEIKALDYFHKGLSIQGKVLGLNHPDYANTCYIFGSYFTKLGQWENALSYFQKGLTSLSNNFDETDIYANPSPKEVASKNILLDLLAAKATVLLSRYQMGANQNILDLEGSFTTYKTALELIDQLKFEITSTISKQEFIEKSIPVYEKSIEVSYELFKLHNNKEYLKQAFEFSEKSKAFLLLQELKYSKIKKYAGIPDSVVEQEKSLNIKLAFYNSELHSAIQKKDSAKTKTYREKLLRTRTAYESIREEIEKRYSRYHQLKYEVDEFSVEEVQEKLLDEHSMLLEFFVGEDQLYLFSITKDDFNTLIIKKTVSYKKWIQDFKEGLTNYQQVIDASPKTKRAFVNAAHGLYGILLSEPLGASKQSLKKIIVVPDGELSYLNFEALLIRPPENPERFKYKGLSYLIKDYSVSYAYSSTFLRNSTEAPKSNASVRRESTFGGYAPKYASSAATSPVDSGVEKTATNVAMDIMALPGAEKEVRSIAEKLDGKAWFGSSATEKVFKETAGSHQILHLAMHGLLDDTEPMFSRLLFAQKEESTEDGYLNVSEIYNLELNADLAVLSACDSGYGKINKGEGMMSLSRAFAYAGCPSLVASLWKVPDETTVAPMIDFYDYLMVGFPIDEALRKSKLNYLQNIENPLYEHPYFWAGFIAHGNTQPLNIESQGLKGYKYALAALLIGIIILFLFRNRKRSTKSSV
ncbi:CHAT domain-containing protein [Flagellimonas hymeniacidonis]|uniref:CHAT domain-containing protein n=1 Tax=Flagellimonas hymeniacidonis TaxID=2603628 RepID=A0A5C8V9A0_9FLAO|nr:CHAT domain-containing tetratricopeptide repeat protein [Flagellimonas hymeniacidonis]TXN38292.1 CHAT domain-containing protein [Flagellimonas hymeniacidonis]